MGCHPGTESVARGRRGGPDAAGDCGGATAAATVAYASRTASPNERISEFLGMADEFR